MGIVATSTAQLYETRIRSLLRCAPDLSLFDPVSWVVELRRRDLSLASLKSYASAIRFHARQTLDDSSSFVSKFDHALKAVQDVTAPALPRRRPTIHADVIDALRLAAIGRSEWSDFADIAVDLAEGSFHFGLRPSEWSSVALDGQTLTVRNGKFLRRSMDHGIFKGRIFARANGVSRSMTIRQTTADDFHLENLVSRITTFFAKKSFKRHQRAIQIEFRKVVRLAVKQGTLDGRYGRLTLYSFRHQFAATAKANVSAKSGSVAALMGHISARTALQSYARKASGRVGGLSVEPATSSIAAVENLRVFDAAVFGPDGEVLEPASEPVVGPYLHSPDGTSDVLETPPQPTPNKGSSGFKPPGGK